MSELRPRPVGTVPRLLGTALSAEVAFDDPDERLAGYELELAPGRVKGRSTAWEAPLWRFSSETPRFDALEGRWAHDGMKARRRRPLMELSVAEPIDAYSWVLRQDGKVLEKVEGTTEGIAPDGRSFTFRPGRRLRRSGQKGPARDEGVFYPPLDSHLPGMPRTPASRIRYSALTHAGHVDEDAYAVDFNYGSGDQDRGHWVRAAAAGVVDEIRPENGEIRLRHPKFDGADDYHTVYAHLTPRSIEDLRVGRWFEAQERIGRIGDTYYRDTPISPHLHHQHLRAGQPTKMRLLINGRVSTVPVSRRDPERTEYWSRKVPGWIQPRGPATAQLAVWVRRASDGAWSPRNRLRFAVAKKDAEIPAGPPAGPGQHGEGPRVTHAYNGPELEPGPYTVRWRARSDQGTLTPWAYDTSVVVEPAFA